MQNALVSTATPPPKPLRPVKYLAVNVSPASAAAPLELDDIAEAFSLIDANGDGVLSRAEVIKACRASERVRTLLGLPKNIRQEDGTRDSFEEVFQKFDADDSKSITLDEFSGRLLKRTSPQAPAPTPSQGMASTGDVARPHVRAVPAWVSSPLREELSGRRKKAQFLAKQAQIAAENWAATFIQAAFRSRKARVQTMQGRESSHESADEHYAAMVRARAGSHSTVFWESTRQELLALLESLTFDGKAPGQALPAPQVSQVISSIAALDASLPVPATIKQRRAMIDAWFQENADADPTPDIMRLARLAFGAVCSEDEVESARQRGVRVADFHVLRAAEAEGEFRIHANRTHCFCRVGDRFLLTREEAWVELVVHESGSASEGEHKGMARVQARSVGAVLRERGAGGSTPVWNFDEVHPSECAPGRLLELT